MSLFVYSVNSAQCQASNLARTSTSATSLSISWTCYDQAQDDEFYMRYRLQNLGQCEEGGSRTDDPFVDSQITQWSTWNRQPSTGNVYQHSATLSNLIPHSIYWVIVRTRQPTGAGAYNYEFSNDLNPSPTTSEAGEFV